MESAVESYVKSSSTAGEEVGQGRVTVVGTRVVATDGTVATTVGLAVDNTAVGAVVGTVVGGTMLLLSVEAVVGAAVGSKEGRQKYD